MFGRERNKRASKKPRSGRGTVGKTPAVGSYNQAAGQIWLVAVSSVDGPAIRLYFRSLAPGNAKLRTDQAAVYAEAPGIARESVNHSKGQYWWNGVTTNTIESVWALLRRIMMGTHHHVSRKHLPRYIAELIWRDNHRCLPVIERMGSIVKGMAGKRLTREMMRQGGRDALNQLPRGGSDPPAQMQLFQLAE